MTVLRVLQTNLWRSHPYLLCPDECWKHMFPIMPPDIDPVRTANMNMMYGHDDVLPFTFAHVNHSQSCAFIVIRDGNYRPSAGRGDEHSVIVPPDHPQLPYLEMWVDEADSLSELHERVLRWLVHMHKENKQPIRTIRKAWPFMADLLSKHKHAYNYASPVECYLDKTMMERYESIIAKGLLNPPIDENRTLVHASNLAPLYRTHK